MLTARAHYQRGGERAAYRFVEKAWVGHGLPQLLGQNSSPGPFYLFFFVLSFSLFCFSDLFISFAFLLQNDSNQIVNFTKNEQNILE
jgi:hypothetical protein